MSKANDIRMANKARRAGMNNSLRIIWEARRAGLPLSLAFALVEQETGNCANVFGHDPTIFVGAGLVTKRKYLAYKAQRRATGKMQGVGPVQLTWYAFQDQADAMGGCWKVKYNLRVGFTHLAQLIAKYGVAEGVRMYNGSGPAAQAYSNTVRRRAVRWHSILV